MQPLTIDEYTAYKALGEGFQIKGYEAPQDKFNLVAKAGSPEQALRFALESNDLSVLVTALFSDKGRHPILDSQIPDDIRGEIRQRVEELARDPSGHLIVASVYREHGLLEDSLRHYIESDPNNQTIPFLLDKMGRHREASEQWQRLAEVYPPNSVLFQKEAAESAKKDRNYQRASDLYNGLKLFREAVLVYIEAGKVLEAELLYSKYVDQRLGVIKEEHQVRNYGNCYPECPDLSRDMANGVSQLAEYAKSIGLTDLSQSLLGRRKGYLGHAELNTPINWVKSNGIWGIRKTMNLLNKRRHHGPKY